MKKIMIALLVLMILLISGCKTEVPSQDEKEAPEEQLVGADRDEHGCIGSAGYTWCESKQKCLREWEEPCIDVLEITNFEECVEAGYPIMESYPRQCKAEDKLFVEEIENIDEIEEVQDKENMEEMEDMPEEKTMVTVEECRQQNGRLVNTLRGDTCNDNEVLLGEVKEFISPNICCVKK